MLVAVVLVAAPSLGILWTPSMAMLSDGAEARGIEQGYAVALTNLAWSTGQTLGSAGGARLGEAYGDALPYLLLAAMCALTLRRAHAAALLGGAGWEVKGHVHDPHPRPKASSSAPPRGSCARREPVRDSGS